MSSKSTYVDGFVLVVKKSKIPVYKKMAEEGKKMWMGYGAIDYKECVGDDLYPKWALPFPKMLKLKKGETVVFSYITYKSKAHRDQINAKVMKGMEKDKDKHKNMEMPFDMKKMAYGGFKVIVSS